MIVVLHIYNKSLGIRLIGHPANRNKSLCLYFTFGPLIMCDFDPFWIYISLWIDCLSEIRNYSMLIAILFRVTEAN